MIERIISLSIYVVDQTISTMKYWDNISDVYSLLLLTVIILSICQISSGFKLSRGYQNPNIPNTPSCLIDNRHKESIISYFHKHQYSHIYDKSTKSSLHLHEKRLSESIKTYINSTDIIASRRANSWWPFKNSIGSEIPEYLDGTLAGDNGFDPLRLAKNKETLFTMREAEYKHARLAMLAAIGWPSSGISHDMIKELLCCHYYDPVELVHYQLMANQSPDTYDFRAPSVLNGGLDNEMVLFGLGLFFSIGAVLEYDLIKRKEREKEMASQLKNFFDMWREDGWDVPGNYGFDPLRLGYYMSGNDNDLKFLIQTVEIFNGRVAMLAVVGFVVQEFVSGDCS